MKKYLLIILYPLLLLPMQVNKNKDTRSSLHLKDNVGNIGNVLIHKPTLASTNVYAHNLLTANTPPKDGTVIFTDYQADGIGQLGSSWYTEAHKAVTMSVILFPSFLSPLKHFYLTIAVSLAVHRISIYYAENLNPTIKWPNDILLDRRKLCGILLKTSIKKRHFSSLVIGIGLNIFPFDVIPDTPYDIAFLDEGEKKLPPLDLLVLQLCNELNYYYNKLKAEKYAELLDEYYINMFRFNKLSSFYDRNTGQTFKGTINGINHRGDLLIKTNQGQKAYAVKSIKYLIND